MVQAAQGEASALSAVTAWYRNVQRQHAAAGLGDDPILASILPGSAQKLSRRDPPANDGGAAEAQVGTGPARIVWTSRLSRRCCHCRTMPLCQEASCATHLNASLHLDVAIMACCCAPPKCLIVHSVSAWLRQNVGAQKDKGGPLLQALVASLPAVPQMPKKPSARLPGGSSAASTPARQGQVWSCELRSAVNKALCQG